MSTPKIPQPTPADPERGPSHWITRANHSPYDKEEIGFDFRTEWRGDPVIVRISARRSLNGWNRDALTWSDWQTYAESAGVTSDDNPFSGYRNPVSQTARARLGDVCRPLVEAWIDSPDYDRSRARAIAHLVKGELPSVKYNGARALLENVRTEMNEEDARWLEHCLDALDEYSKAYDDA